MSIRTMAKVWEHSKHAGTELLMLLAIADFADDDGRAYPSVAGLAAKCRMKPRNANYILASLRASGELRVRVNEGPKGKNLYQLRFTGVPAAGLQASAPLQSGAGVQRSAGLQSVAPTPAMECAKPLHPIAAEPSLNRQEPSEGSAPSSRAGLPACPHRQLIALFTSKVPDLPKPRVEMWTDSAAAKDMAARWKFVLTETREDGSRYASTVSEAVAWFGRFFDTVAESEFLTGRNGRFHGCDLQWLMKRDNFRKVVEKKYVNRGAA